MMTTKKPKQGTGARFKAMKNKIMNKGYSEESAGAITAAAGRKKLGKERFQKLAAAGRKKK